jgi:hypothetical protein
MLLTVSINHSTHIHTLNYVEKSLSYAGMITFICIPFAIFTIGYSVCNIALSEGFGYFETKKVTKLYIDLETETDETKKIELNKEIEESCSKIKGYIQSREKGYYLIHLAIFQLILPVIGNIITYQRYMQNELARKNAEELKDEETTQGEDLDKKIQDCETTIKNLNSKNEGLKKKTDDLIFENEKISNEKAELEKQNENLTFTNKSLQTSLKQPKELGDHNIFKKKAESEEIGKLKDEIENLKKTISESLEMDFINKVYDIVLKHFQNMKEKGLFEGNGGEKDLNYKNATLDCIEIDQYCEELYKRKVLPTSEQIGYIKMLGERFFGYLINNDDLTKKVNESSSNELKDEKNSNEEGSKKTLFGELKKVFTPGQGKKGDETTSSPVLNKDNNGSEIKKSPVKKLSFANLNLLKKKERENGGETPNDGGKTPKLTEEKTGNKTPRGDKTPRSKAKE